MRFEDATLIFTIDKLPHDTDYMITVQPSFDGQIMMLYAGNNQGDVFIYQISNLIEAAAAVDDFM